MKNDSYLASLRQQLWALEQNRGTPPTDNIHIFLKFQKINFGECRAIKNTVFVSFWDPWHKQKFAS